jgi:hypothetical protein
MQQGNLPVERGDLRFSDAARFANGKSTVSALKIAAIQQAPIHSLAVNSLARQTKVY